DLTVTGVQTCALPIWYPGSPQRIFMRYKYVYPNLFQFGIIAEKDPGEQLFRGNQQQGFDFYSIHLFARNIGRIKSLALGDFTVRSEERRVGKGCRSRR